MLDGKGTVVAFFGLPVIAEQMRDNVAIARQTQAERFAGTSTRYNAQMSSRDVRKYCELKLRWPTNQHSPVHKMDGTNWIPMAYEDKGALPRGGKYLRCDNARRGLACNGSSIRYIEVETLILENCRKLEINELISSDENAVADTQRLHRQESSFVARRDQLTEQQDILAERIATTADAWVGAVLDGKLSAVLNERDQIQAELCRVSKEIKETMATAKRLQSWQADLNTLVESERLNDAEFRLQLRERLRQVIKCVEVFTNGFEAESTGKPAEGGQAGRSRGEIGRLRQLPTTDDFRETMDAIFEASRTNANRANMRAFTDFVMRRRMSKEGRFIRIHFVSSVVQDLVPPGSLASGLAIVERDGGTVYAPVGPDINALWQAFLPR